MYIYPLFFTDELIWRLQ